MLDAVNISVTNRTDGIIRLPDRTDAQTSEPFFASDRRFYLLMAGPHTEFVHDMTLIQANPSTLAQQQRETMPHQKCLVDLTVSQDPEMLPWHVLHTLSRQEKALARTLQAADIHYELPLSQRVRMYGHRKRVVMEPLFSNYLFVQGSLEVTYFAMATKRVANVIPVPDQASLIRDLKQIRMVLGKGAELNPYRFLTVGRRVRVMAGPFKDVEGYIEEKPKPDRLILKIDALSRAASLEIDASLLEPVE